LNLIRLLDDEKCFSVVRELRWPDGVQCPHCANPYVTKQGRDDTQRCRQRYRCLHCQRKFDDLTGTVFAGHHQPLRQWVGCLYLMGLNLSNRQIAQELGLNENDVQDMTRTLRQGVADGLIKEMRMPPSSGILMVYDNKKPDWRRRHYVIRPVVPLAEKSTVARPTSPHHDHLDAGWSDALQIHSSSAVVLFSSLRKPDKRKARSGGSSVPSFSRRFQEQRSFKLF